jgi:hypothetical protein
MHFLNVFYDAIWAEIFDKFSSQGDVIWLGEDKNFAHAKIHQNLIPSYPIWSSKIQTNSQENGEKVK